MRDEAPQSGPDVGPLFVAGCGRSGTTLLRTWLASHPEVFIPTESLFLKDYVTADDAVPEGVKRFLFYREPQLRCWYTGPQYPLSPLGQGIRSVHEYEASRKGARVWGQKTPRFIRSMRAFDRVLPGIRWILVHRDPRAVVASMRRSARHTGSVTRAVRRWKRDNAPVLRVLRTDDHEVRRSPLVVSYEHLVATPDVEWARICDFAGIERIDLGSVVECASVERLGRSRFANNAIRDGTRPEPSRQEAWRQELSAEEIAYIETLCRPEMRAFGYERISAEERFAPGLRIRELGRQVSDLAIVREYSLRWPEYLVWTAVRKIVLGLFQVAAYGRARLHASTR